MSKNTKRIIFITLAILAGAISIAPFGRVRAGKRAGGLATLAMAIVGAVAAYRRQPEGELLGVPYSFRMPTPGRVKSRLWNPDDPRIFTPHIFGWGWSINFNALLRKAGVME